MPLAEETGSPVSQVRAYVGPHIGREDYEVSPELAARFSAEFGPEVIWGERNLDLGAAVKAALMGAGVPSGSIACYGASTASATREVLLVPGRARSCGRHGALAVMPEE